MLAAALMAVGVLVATDATAITIPGDHTTDGMFTDPFEWTTARPTVSKTVFPRVGNAGGAALYAEQKGGVLYLMYDYFAPFNAGPSSFFDVFFQVKNEDYLVRIMPGPTGISPNNVWVKPADQPSNTNPDGSFNTGTPWTPLILEDPSELNLAQFRGAIGQGSSPENPSSHPMAEFELTINQLAFSPPPAGGGHDGIYDPDPAFWSASSTCPQKSTCPDPPISSAIFTLNADGTTTLAPVVGPDGAPIMQSNVPQAAPEPASFALLGAGLAALGALRRRQRD